MDEPRLFVAYIDAGTAGYIIQMTLALAGGAIVYGLIFWKRVSSKIASIFSRSNSDQPTPGETATGHQDTSDTTRVD